MDQTIQNQPVELKNAGQKVIYELRQSYLQGSLAASNNPAPEIQVILNKPIKIDPKLYQADPQDKSFLKDLIKKIEAGDIHLFTPSTLLNKPVYDQSSEEIKAKADYDILTLLHKIRQIKQLWDSGDRESYQIMNLVNSLRLAKERLESLEGDLFII
jgi:hypothetical protein